MQEKILLIQAFVCPKIAEWQMLNNREQSRNLRALAFNLPPEEAAFVTRRIPTLRIEIDGT